MIYGVEQGKNCINLFAWDMQQCSVPELTVLQSQIMGFYSTFCSSIPILFRISKHGDGVILCGNTQYNFFPNLKIACVTFHLFLPCMSSLGLSSLKFLQTVSKQMRDFQGWPYTWRTEPLSTHRTGEVVLYYQNGSKYLLTGRTVEISRAMSSLQRFACFKEPLWSVTQHRPGWASPCWLCIGLNNLYWLRHCTLGCTYSVRYTSIFADVGK